MNVLKKNNDHKYLSKYNYTYILSLNLLFANPFFQKNKAALSTKPLKKLTQVTQINCVKYKYNIIIPLSLKNTFKIDFTATLKFKKCREPIFFKLNFLNKLSPKSFLHLINPLPKNIFVKYNYNPRNLTKIFKDKYDLNMTKFKVEKKKTFLKNLFLKKKDMFSLMDSQIINFLMFLFNKNVLFAFKKLNPGSKDVEFDSEARYIIWKMMSKYHKKINYRFMRTFYKVLFFSFKLKDPNFFLDWYINILELERSKRHKFLVHILYILLKKFHRYIFFSSNIKGMFFYISGKIGVSGNSKKRNIFFNFGKHSNTKKSLRVNSTKSIVKTLTGALGVTFNIYF